MLPHEFPPRLAQRREALFPWVDEKTYLVAPQITFEDNYVWLLPGEGPAAAVVDPGDEEPVLAAWGYGASGGKVLLHLMAGSKEDAETVTAFFQDMRAAFNKV